MPRDDHQRAKNRDHQKAANGQLAEYGHLTTYDSIYDTPWESSASGTPVKLKDWLNEIRSKAGKLAEKIPQFRMEPARGDRAAVPLISHALATASETDLVLLEQLVRRIGDPAVTELKRICDRSSDSRMRSIARFVLDTATHEHPLAENENTTDPLRRSLTGQLSLVREPTPGKRTITKTLRGRRHKKNLHTAAGVANNRIPPSQGGIGSSMAPSVAHLTRPPGPVMPQNPVPQNVPIMNPVPAPSNVIVIDGISLSKDLATWTTGHKWLENGRWLISTKAGRIVGEFPTEAALDAWWRRFNESRGRTPKPLLPRNSDAAAQSRSARSKRKKPKRFSPAPPNGTLATFTPNALNGPLKPWSEKYDMPEFDCE
jgi:hypothetical protein